MYNRHYIIPNYAALPYPSIESVHSMLGCACALHLTFTDILGFKNSMLIIATRPTSTTTTIIMRDLRLISWIRCNNCNKMLNSAVVLSGSKSTQDQIQMSTTLSQDQDQKRSNSFQCQAFSLTSWPYSNIVPNTDCVCLEEGSTSCQTLTRV